LREEEAVEEEEEEEEEVEEAEREAAPRIPMIDEILNEK